MNKIFLILSLSLLLTGCYRMPTDDDYSVVPNTNNPYITGDKAGQMGMPTMGY